MRIPLFKQYCLSGFDETVCLELKNIQSGGNFPADIVLAIPIRFVLTPLKFFVHQYLNLLTVYIEDSHGRVPRRVEKKRNIRT